MMYLTWKGLYAFVSDFSYDMERYQQEKWNVDVLRNMYSARSPEPLTAESESLVSDAVLEVLGYSFAHVYKKLVWNEDDLDDALMRGLFISV